jgi:transcription antitermination protein NusB
VLNRRHIRIKVMQSIYAMHQKNSDDLVKEEKFLLHSIDGIFDLYLIMLSLLVEIRKKEILFLETSAKKHLATSEDKSPNNKFVNNSLLKMLAENASLSNALNDRKIDNWTKNDDYIILFLNEIKQSELYNSYMINRVNTFQEDKRFVVDMFLQLIAPNDKLYDYIEDHNLTWIDDVPVVNTQILKELKSISEDLSYTVSHLYKDDEDREYVGLLLKKTILNEKEFEKEYFDKTPNWDTDRIAELDTILIKMAICEFLKFPSIPLKVTINEYLEIAKEYSTPKSSIFINGLLDNLVKEFTQDNRIKKVGRGLL